MSRLIVFDVDGTLVDSQGHIVEAQTRAFARHNLPAPSRVQALSVVGLSLHEAFTALVGPEGPVASLAEAYKAAWGELLLAPDFADTLYPGARETLLALSRRDGVVLGIATGKSTRGVRRFLSSQGWSTMFATVQTADDHPSKPHPSMLLTALAETGCDARDTVMIGDTRYDIAMAVAAGVRPIGVAWGYHEPETLAAAGATAVAASFDSLLILLSEETNEVAEHR